MSVSLLLWHQKQIKSESKENIMKVTTKIIHLLLNTHSGGNINLSCALGGIYTHEICMKSNKHKDAGKNLQSK